MIAPKARFQPVFVEDLGEGHRLGDASIRQAHGGKTYEIGGPQVLSMRELTVEILKAAGREPGLVDVPDPVTSLISRFGFLPGAPLTRDQWLMLQHDNVARRAAGLDAFGITPDPVRRGRARMARHVRRQSLRRAAA